MVVDLPAPFGPSRPKISPGPDLEGDAVERYQFELLGRFFFLAGAHRPEGEARAAHRRRGVEYFAQIFDADSDSHDGGYSGAAKKWRMLIYIPVPVL